MDSQTAYMHATFNQSRNVHIGFYPKKNGKKEMYILVQLYNSRAFDKRKGNPVSCFKK
jgi:hypothetical protein